MEHSRVKDGGRGRVRISPDFGGRRRNGVQVQLSGLEREADEVVTRLLSDLQLGHLARSAASERRYK